MIKLFLALFLSFSITYPNLVHAQGHTNICDKIKNDGYLTIGYWSDTYVTHFEDLSKKVVLNYPKGGEDSLFKYLFDSRVKKAFSPYKIMGQVNKYGFSFLIVDSRDESILFSAGSKDNRNMKNNLYVEGTNSVTKFISKSEDVFNKEFLTVTEEQYKSSYNTTGKNDMRIISVRYFNEKLRVYISGISFPSKII